MSRIVGVKFQKKDTGEYEGKEYNYYDEVGLSGGEIAIVPFGEKERIVRVTTVDVPESQIDERIFPLLKTITKRYEPAESEGTDNE